jgi:hypothetical protein
MIQIMASDGLAGFIRILKGVGFYSASYPSVVIAFA